MSTGTAVLRSSTRTWNGCRWRSPRRNGTPGSSIISRWPGFKRLERQQETARGECVSRHLALCRGGPGSRLCRVCVAVAAWLDPKRTLLVRDHRSDLLRLHWRSCSARLEDLFRVEYYCHLRQLVRGR